MANQQALNDNNGVKSVLYESSTVPGETVRAKGGTDGSMLTASAASQRQTYSASFTVAPVSGATAVVQMIGSASKKIRINEIHIDGTATARTRALTSIIRRSTASTGGTSTTQAAVPHDSTNSAATAVVRAYTANPTSLGTIVGTAVRVKNLILDPTTVDGTSSPELEITFGETSQAVVLNGVAQSIEINLNATVVAGGSMQVGIEWTEE